MSVLPEPPIEFAKESANRFLQEHSVSSKKRKVEEEEEESGETQKSSVVLQQPPEEVAGFVRTLYTLLKICDPSVVAWSDDGSSMEIHDPSRFASEVCPKFFRHRNFNSFTRLLNMYQFHKIPSNGREQKSVIFVHPCFKRDQETLLPRIQRKGANTKASLDAKKKQDNEKEKESLKQEKDTTQTAAPSTKKVKCSNDERSLMPIAHKAGTATAEKGGKRAPSIFPSAARYKAVGGIPEALISAKVWEKTNAEINDREKKTGFLSQSTVGGSSAVSTWMRRVVELEREAKRLKQENSRLKSIENEMDGLRSQLITQSEMIRNLQLQLGSPAAFIGAAGSGHMLTSVPSRTSDPVEKMTAALLAGNSDVDADGGFAHNTNTCADDIDWNQLMLSATNDKSTTNDDTNAALRQLMAMASQQGTSPQLDQGAVFQTYFQQLATKVPNAHESNDLSVQHFAAAFQDNPFMSQCFAQCLSACGQLPSTFSD